ncbi:MAG: DUF4221 family protein [Thermonemataceae bacterium]|nr:DUF4221 family protein [Thermonemataceae bacterium]
MKFIFFILLIISFSCQQQETRRQSFKNKIKVVKSVNISLDSLTPQHLFNPQLVKNKYLVFLNSKANSLDIYSFERKKLSERIKFLNEGEEGIGKVYQFLYHNDDSIFVVNSYQYKVFLIDKTGKVKEKYSLIKQKKHSAITAMPEIFPFHHPIVLINNQLHITSSPDDNPYKDSFFEREALSIVLNLETKDFHYEMSFPELYRKKYFTTSVNFHSRVFLVNENRFIYSFFADQHIYKIDLAYKILEEKKLQSPNFTEIPALKKRLQSSQENTKIANQSPAYINIYYNPYKREFYRMIDIPIAKESKEQRYSKGFLGIFNQSFENIGEVLLFETNQLNNYNTMNLFFTSEGMWIQRFTDNEDELVYDLVEFVAE